MKTLAEYLAAKRNKFSHMGVFICADTRVRVKHEPKVPGSRLQRDGLSRSTFVRSGHECLLNAASFDGLTTGHITASREELMLVAERAQMLLRLYENSASDDELKSGMSEKVSSKTAVCNV